MTTLKLSRLIAMYACFAFWAHYFRAKKKSKRIRYHDGITPFAVHPLWCAMTLLLDPKVPNDIRYKGALALIIHDILEDTDAKLPGFINSEVRELAEGMTFSSSAAEPTEVWERGDVIILLEVYDKTCNILDASEWLSAEKRAKRVEHLRRLIAHAEPIYGQLQIFSIARAIM